VTPTPYYLKTNTVMIQKDIPKKVMTKRYLKKSELLFLAEKISGYTPRVTPKAPLSSENYRLFLTIFVLKMHNYLI